MAARINRVDHDVKRKVEAFAFRATEAFARDLSTLDAREARQDAIKRAAGRDVILTFFDSIEGRHRAVNLGEEYTTELPNQDIDWLRQHELDKVITDNADACYLTSTAAYHLKAPSGSHCVRFLRVGDALRTFESLETVAFWLAEVARQSAAILVDTPSFASPILLAERLTDTNPIVEFLPGHPSDFEAEAERTLEGLLSQLPLDGVLTVLVSVSSTGALIDSLRSIVEGLGGPTDRIQYVSLYAFSDADSYGRVLCRLRDAANNSSSDDCSLCATGNNTVIEIDSRVYFYRDRNEQTTRPLSKDFEAGSLFIRRYQHVEDAFRVHRHDRNDQRHHAFDIDVNLLLDDTTFRESYIATLETIHRPTVIVAPEHASGRALARIASEKFAAKEVIHNDLRTSSGLALRDREALREAADILIVDDVLNTGTRLDRYNRALREDLGEFHSVTFLVGIARPQSRGEWESHQKRLTQRHNWTATLKSVESIFLPRWKSDQCPWCQEYNILSRLSQRFARPPEWLTKRLWLLTQRPDGISDPLLTLPGTPQTLVAGTGAVPGEGFSPILTVFSIATALQSLRSKTPDAALTFKGLRPRLLDLGVFNLYTEGLLTAAFLRSADPREWSAATASDLKNHLIAAANDRKELLGEMLVLGARRPDLRCTGTEFDSLFTPVFADATGRMREILCG
ncbi:MAG TPA: phosphoribosyltransferase family protein [Candidatus Binatia bacterium]|nr:phosphoribosyltransferase family protein [Candidatus Binatia bacterium]